MVLTAKGYVRTPKKIVQRMLSKLFELRTPNSNDKILDPGCGPGTFIEGIIDWCDQNNISLPTITGVELDTRLAAIATEKFKEYKEITIENKDFLTRGGNKFDFIIGNPPYVSITQLTQEEKNLYKPLFKTAKNRFDLYLLFFEKALCCLKEDGFIVFITPEKFTYVASAEPLRLLLRRMQIKEIEFLSEDTFAGLTTYPTITTIHNIATRSSTCVLHRDGNVTAVELPNNGESWQPLINGTGTIKGKYVLEDICSRISCGVATGADKVFVMKNNKIPSELKKFSYPTISGRDLIYGKEIEDAGISMLIPYNMDGKLLPYETLGAFTDYLEKPKITKKLKARTCVKKKPWYSFHETPPMNLFFQPKILCKDISKEPSFWLDKDGKYVPRHSVYFIIPKNPEKIVEILNYLRSKDAENWLEKNCQRASKGFIRLQSSILKKLPIPDRLYVDTVQNSKD